MPKDDSREHGRESSHTEPAHEPNGKATQKLALLAVCVLAVLALLSFAYLLN
ncbi:MAG: hypothetical protein NVV62_17150 [Terricaulis sp.]|nr:hypothetical protein [Terricaulis sp.]